MSSTDPTITPEARSITAHDPKARIDGEPVGDATNHLYRLLAINHRTGSEPIGDFGPAPLSAYAERF